MPISIGKKLANIHSYPKQIEPLIWTGPREPKRLALALSAQAGSGAFPIARRVAENLQSRAPVPTPAWRVFDRNLVAKVLEDHHLPMRLAKFLPEDAHSAVDEMMDEIFGLHPPSWMLVQQSIETIHKLVEEGNVVIVGWAVNAIARDLPNVLHVRLVGSIERRIARIQARDQVSRKAARGWIERADRGRARYSKHYFQSPVSDVLLYDLTINTDHLSDAQAAAIISDALMMRQTSLGSTAPILAAAKAASKPQHEVLSTV